MEFEIRQCLRLDCRFRFPVPCGSTEGNHCPRCESRTTIACSPFDGRGATQSFAGTPSLALEVLLDNLRSSHNVGSIFRSCDGAGVRHVHLCGITATPTQGKVGRAALGAEATLPWTYHCNGVDAIRSLKREGCQVWSLENREPSQSIFDLDRQALSEPTILVIGNELSGVDPGILALSERVVSIPMLGHKSSLNAAVAFGIFVYWLVYGLRRQSKDA